MALHAPQVHGFFSIPVDHLNAIDVLADHFRSYDLSNTVVVSPDLGNAKMAAEFARRWGSRWPPAPSSGWPTTRVVIDRIVGDVRGRDVIVLDDEIATGGSIVELLRKLRSESVAQISLACTHGLFTGPAIERLKQEPDLGEIVTHQHGAAAVGESGCRPWSPDRSRRCSPRPSSGSTMASRSAACSATSKRTVERSPPSTQELGGDRASG